MMNNNNLDGLLGKKSSTYRLDEAMKKQTL